MSGGICYSCRHLLRCTLFISLFIFRRRLRGTICIHILSGYLQQHLRLRCTFFSILFSLLFFLLCYTFQHTRHTEPRFCLSLPFFLLFWYFIRQNIFNGCMAVLECQAVFAYFFSFFYGFLWLFSDFLCVHFGRRPDSSPDEGGRLGSRQQ